MAHSLRDRRVVIIGASAGIGRELAIRAIGDGATVVLAARRGDRLSEVVQEAGAGLPVPVDIADPQSCAGFATQVRELLGEVDLVVCGAAYSPLRWFDQADADVWRRVLDINVVGTHQVIKRLLPICAPRALVAVMSSESTMQPRHALGVYAASKAALEMSMRRWRLEQPATRFTTMVVGGTFPTDFAADFDPDVLVPAMQEWARHGTVQEDLMTPQDVAEAMRGALAAVIDLPGVSLDEVVIRSPSAVAGSAQHLQDDAADNIARINSG